MFPNPPHLTKQHWVYDDPSGIAEPAPYARPWPRRAPKPRPAVHVNVVRRARIAHREA
jgi:hypothetical protein